MSNRIVKKLTDNRFVNLFEVCDPENHCKAYQFAERRGKDSIAFICYDTKTKKFLLNREFTPPTGQFDLRAFGGSLDKVGKTHLDIVIEEVEEEAGYKANSSMVYSVGHCFVSTQMNQQCYLFLVLVNDDFKTERKPENKIEEMAEPIWLNLHDILANDDWKAISIIMKAVDKRILKVTTEDIGVER